MLYLGAVGDRYGRKLMLILGMALSILDYSAQITSAAKSSFLDGADWAYLAGIIAVLVGAALVYFLFPRRDTEKQLLRTYASEADSPLRQLK